MYGQARKLGDAQNDKQVLSLPTACSSIFVMFLDEYVGINATRVPPTLLRSGLPGPSIVGATLVVALIIGRPDHWSP